VVVYRPEDASGLDRHQAHTQLTPLHALDLGTEINRGQQF
jgi:hypothetical protein